MSGILRLNGATSGYIEIKAPDEANGQTHTIPNTGFAAGKILQVVHANSTSHLSSTSTSYVDLTGVTATITPSATSSKILITCTISISKQDNHTFLARVVKDGSAISGAGGVKESGHNNQLDGVWWSIRTTDYSSEPSTIQYLDSPSTTSAITYKAQGMTSNSGYGWALNRTTSGDDGNYSSPGFSQITLMEVGA
tara:strand:- start:3775 stop:4359 length:585 start_codon:yes stop_codon:yes gene_type:complete